MKRYSMPSHMPDKFPFIDRKMWEKPKMDIVERLREYETWSEDWPIIKEAADEIERLREGLSDIVPFILEWEQFYIDENGVKHTSDIVQEIADGVGAKINAILAP